MAGKFTVRLTDHAKLDLLEASLFYLEECGRIRAVQKNNALETKCATLENYPYRGHIVPELADIGISGYREIHFEYYRIIYSVRGTHVIVNAILDGRRDLEAILLMRLSR